MSRHRCAPCMPQNTFWIPFPQHSLPVYFLVRSPAAALFSFFKARFKLWTSKRRARDCARLLPFRRCRSCRRSYAGQRKLPSWFRYVLHPSDRKHQEPLPKYMTVVPSCPDEMVADPPKYPQSDPQWHVKKLRMKAAHFKSPPHPGCEIFSGRQFLRSRKNSPKPERFRGVKTTRQDQPISFFHGWGSQPDISFMIL